MREIKFRAWDGENMYYFEKGNNITLSFFSEGIPWGVYDSATEQRYITGDPNAIFNRPGKLMQYTGLKDRNGKEIYEGDIIKHPQATEPENVGWIIIWKDFGFIAELANPFIDEQTDQQLKTNLSKYFTKCEIIGNIYSNPELL